MKVLVDGSRCTGHGRCYSLAPEVFDADDEGYSEPRDTAIEVSPATEDVALRCVRACPEGAISLLD